MQPGDRVGSYTLVEHLGSGGMGTVWVARSLAGERVALKLMHPHLSDDAGLVTRFRREFEVGQVVRHPSLIRTLEFGRHQQLPFIVMELAEGKSLRRLVEKGGPFREWEALEITRQVALALADLHGRGIIHRDLKSSNIMVDRTLHPKVIDYGIAKYDGPNTLSVAGGFIGSAEYSGPDLFFGKPATDRLDVYSLGIALFESLTGDVPFRSGHYVDVLKMHAERPVPDVVAVAPLVSRETGALVQAMLAKAADARPSATAVAERCAAILVTQGRGAPSSPARSAAPQRPAVPPAATASPRPVARPPAQVRTPARRGAPGTIVPILIAIAAAASVAVGSVIMIAAGGGG